MRHKRVPGGGARGRSSARRASQPNGGYDKKTQGQDMAHLLDALKIGTVALVTHDIGNMVG